MNNLNNVNANLNNLIPIHNINNNNYGYVSNNDVRNVLRNIERQNVLADNLNLNLMNMNAAELAALENFAMSPGTPSHRNKRARFI
jgi:hypothetical protein